MMQRISCFVLPLLLAACATPPPPESGTATVGLDITLPQEARRFYQPAQVTGDVNIQTDGRVLVELILDNVVRSWVMLNPDFGAAVLSNIEPANGYRLQVLEGLPANNRNLGVVRFASVSTLDIPPDEVLSTSVVLRRCDEDDVSTRLPAGIAANCNPDFGTGLGPPAPPRIFPLPAVSGCNNYMVAGTKPADTVLIDNNVTLIDSSTDPFWQFDLTGAISGASRPLSVARSLRAARAQDQQNRSSQAPMTFNFDPDALCFNPYRVLNGSSDVAGSGSNINLTWTANARTADVGIVVQAVGAPLPTALTALPALGGDVLDVQTVAATDEAAGFARPNTDAYHALLYVDRGTQWSLEGTFTFDADWLTAAGHATLP